MGSAGKLLPLATLLAIVSINASPITVSDGDNKCAVTCLESLSDNGKFQYQVGKTYVYDYESVTTTELDGASSDKTSFKISARANVEVQSKCELTLRLSSVSLMENGSPSQATSEFARRLEAHPLRFAWQDGKIESVCPASSEDVRVLNIKKALLSSMQNSLESFSLEQGKPKTVKETDIAGSCDTTYTRENHLLGGMTLSKTKNLLGCTERFGNMSAIQTETYRVPSQFQSLPITKSTHQCVQEISRGHLSSSVCKEEHMFRPFSKQTSGAVTRTTQTLTFNSEINSVQSNRMDPIDTRTTMLFEHSYGYGMQANARMDVLKTLEDLCSQTTVEVRPQTPMLFTKLIHQMQRLDMTNMASVRSSVLNNRVCTHQRGKKFFFDAVPLVGTVASMRVMVDLMKDNTVQGVEADMWLTQMAFMQHPTAEVLSVAKELITEGNLRNKAVLAVTSLVHNYCNMDSNCAAQASVQTITRTLENILISSNCDASSPALKESALLSLKGLGNMGKALRSSSALARCMEQSSTPAEIRVAALSAYRRLPCSVTRDGPMGVFRNVETDSEVRIGAFLAVMTCPTTSNIQQVKMMLSGENVNQVGSFVWTYMTNLAESSSLHKAELRQMLTDVVLSSNYNLDARKFSRNYEKSIFSEYLNAGATMEGNLIWSTESYIPRSAMLNLTVDMFGSSVNMLEVGGRVQGLETLLERFFGPEGYFSQENVKSMLNREKDIPNYMKIIESLFKINKNEPLSASAYLKLFGNEISYVDIMPMLGDSQSFSRFMMEFMQKIAERKEYEFSRSTEFLHTSLIVPTIAGLPLNFSVQGATTVNVQLSGKMDLRNARAIDIDGSIKPSAAVVFNGEMNVDALVASSSMKMQTTMHSSTVMDGKIQFMPMTGKFSTEMNMPKDRVELLSMETKFFMNGREMAMPNADAVVKKFCSGEMIKSVFGIEVCSDLRLPQIHGDGFPLAPLTGPMSLHQYITKVDTHSKYLISAEFTNEKVDNMYTIVAKLNADTPGSKVDRRMKLEFDFDEPNTKMSASFITPWKKATMRTDLAKTADKQVVTASLLLDQDKKYMITSEYGLEEKRNRNIYRPKITIIMPEKDPMVAQATVSLGTKKPIDIVVTTNMGPEPMMFKGNVINLKNQNTITTEWEIASPWLAGKVTGSNKAIAGGYSFQTDVNYDFKNGAPEHHFTLTNKMQARSTADLDDVSFRAGLSSSQFDFMNLATSASYQLTKNIAEGKVVFKQQSKTIALLSTRIEKAGEWSSPSQLGSSSEMKFSPLNLNYKLDVRHSYSNADLVTALVLTRDGIVTRLGWNVADRMDTTGAINGEIRLEHNGDSKRIAAELSRVSPTENTISAFAQWGPNDMDKIMTTVNAVNVDGTYKFTSKVEYSPYPMEFEGQIRPELKNFDVTVKTIQKYGVYDANMEWTLTEKKAVFKSGINTPQKQYGLVGSMKKNSQGKITAHVGANWKTGALPSESFAVKASVLNQDLATSYSYKMSATLTLPSKSKLSYDYEGTLQKDFKHGTSDLEVSVYGDVIKKRIEYTVGENSLSAEATYRCPKMTASGNILHTGTPTDFDNTVSITVNNKQYSVTSMLKTTATSEGSITVKYPGTTTGGSLRLSGQDEMKANARAFYNSDVITADVAVTPMSYANIRLTGYGQAHEGTVRHTQSATGFTNSIQWTSGQSQWSATTTFTSSPYKVDVSVTTPWTNFENMNGDATFVGDYNNFETSVNGQFSGNAIHSKLTFTGQTATIDIQTPWRNVQGQYNHALMNNGFENRASVQWSANEAISTFVSFTSTTEAFAASAYIVTPFEMARRWDASVTGRMTASGFENKNTLKWATDKTISFEVLFNNPESGIIASATLMTPFEMVRTWKATMEHTMTGQGFNSKASIEWAVNKKISAETDYSKVNGVMVTTASFVTPFSMLTRAHYSVRLQENTHGFESTKQIGWTSSNEVSEYSLNSQWSTANNKYTGSSLLITPHNKGGRVNVQFELSGSSATDFSASASAEVDTNLPMKFSAHSSSYDHAISLENIPCPVVQKMSYSSTYSANEITSGVSWNDKRISAHGLVEGIEIMLTKLEMELTTPFANWERSSLKYTKVSTPDNGREVMVTVNCPFGKTVESKFEINDNGWSKSAKLLGMSEAYEHSMSHKLVGSTYETKLNSIWKSQTVSMISELTIAPFVHVLTINTPFAQLNQLDTTVRFTGNMADFNTMVSMTWTPEDRSQRIVANLEINHESPADRFRTRLSGTVNGNTVTGSAEYSLKPVLLKGSFSYPPQNINWNGEFSFEMLPNSIESKLLATWSAVNRIQSAVIVSLEPFTIKASLKTPFEMMKDINGRVTFTKTNNDISHEASFEWAMDKKIEYNIKYEPLSLVATFSSPWKTGEFSASQQMTSILNKVEGKFTWDNINTVSAEAQIDWNQEVFSASMNTPWTSISSVSIVSVNKEMSTEQFGADITLRYNGKSTRLVVDGGVTPSNGNSRFTFSNDIGTENTMTSNGNFEFTLTENSFDFKSNAAYGTHRVSTTLLLTPANGRFTLTTPFENVESLSARYVHSGASYEQFTNTFNAQWADKVVSSEVTVDLVSTMSVSARLTGPVGEIIKVDANLDWANAVTSSFEATSIYFSPIKATYRHTLNMINEADLLFEFAESVTLSWNNEQLFSSDMSIDRRAAYDIDSTLTVIVPAKNVKISAKHQILASGACKTMLGLTLDTISSYEMVFDFSAEPLSMTLTCTSPIQGWERITAELSASQSASRFVTSWAPNTEIEMKATYSLEPFNFEWTLNTPFQMYEFFKVAHSHSLTINSFNLDSKVFWAQDKSIAIIASAAEKKFTLTIDTPFEAFKSYSGTFIHRGDWENFTQESSMTLDTTNLYTWTARVNKGEGLTFNVNFQSAMATFTCNHESSANMIKCSMAAIWNGHDTTFVINKNANTVHISLTTPWSEEMAVTGSHTGDFQNFVNKCTLKFGTMETIATTTLSMVNQEIEFTLTQPSISFKFNHDGTLESRSFEDSLSASYMEYRFDGTQTIEFGENKQGGRIVIRETPIGSPVTFEMWNEKTATGGYEFKGSWGSDYDLLTKVDFEVAEKIWSFNYDMTVKTPLPGWENNNVAFNYEHRMKSFHLATSGHIGAATNKATFTMDIKDLTKPSRWAYEYDISMEHADYPWSTSGRVFLNDIRYKYGLSTKMAIPGHSVDFKFVVNHKWTGDALDHTGLCTLTWTAQETLAREYNWAFNMTPKMYSTSITGVTQTNPASQLSFRSQANWENDITFSASGKIPSYQIDAKTDLTLSGTLENFNLVASASAVPAEPFSVKVTFNKDQMLLRTELDTPFTEAMTFNTNGNFQETAMHLSLNGSYGTETASLTGNYNVNEMSADVTFECSKTEKFNAVFKANAIGTEWSSQIRGSYGDQMMTLTGSMSDSMITGHLTTPFQGYTSTQFSVKYSMTQLPNSVPDRIHFESVFNTDQLSSPVKVTASFVKAGTMNLSVSSPWELVRSLEFTSAFNARPSLHLTLNGNVLANAEGSYDWTSTTVHSGRLTVSVPALMSPVTVSVSDDLDFSDNVMSQVVSLTTQGKTFSWQYNNRKTSSGQVTVTLNVRTPYANFDNMNYSLTYSGDFSQWTQTTVISAPNVQVTISSSATLTDSKIAYKEDGQANIFGNPIEYGVGFEWTPSSVSASVSLPQYMPTPATLSLELDPMFKGSFAFMGKAWVIEGDLSETRFVLNTTLTWSASQSFTLETTLNLVNNRAVNGAILVSLKDSESRYPTETVKVNFSGSSTAGDLTVETLLGTEFALKRTFTYTRSETKVTSTAVYEMDGSSPLSWDIQIDLEPYHFVWNTNFDISFRPFKTIIDVTPQQGSIELVDDEKSGFKFTFENAEQNNEYKPNIVFRGYDRGAVTEQYTFHGIYKNEGLGKQRDFKLHFIGPVESHPKVDFKMELLTLSSEGVPGEFKWFLASAGTNKDRQVWLDMTTEWGNDRVIMKFVEPRPMEYSIDATIGMRSTRLNTIVNWDTTKPHSNVALAMAFNKPSSVKTETEVSVSYKGVQYEFELNSDMQERAMKHNILFDLAGNRFGYNFELTRPTTNSFNGMFKLITPLQSIEYQHLSTISQMSFSQFASFKWDADRQANKMLSAKVEYQHSGDLCSTVVTLHHPALQKDVTLENTLTMNDNTFDIRVVVDYSLQLAKKIEFKLASTTAKFVEVSLKHPHSTINWKYTLFWKNDFNDNNFVSEFKYLSASDNTFKTVAWKMMHKDLHVKVEGLTPLYNVIVNADLTDNSNEYAKYNFLISCNVNGMSTTSMGIKLDEEAVKAEMMVHHNLALMFSAVAEKVNDSRYQVVAFHMHGAEKHEDLLLSAGVNDSESASGRINWRPATITEVKDKIATVKSQMNEILESAWTSFMTETYMDWKVCSETEAVIAYSQAELETVKAEFEQLKNNFEAKYEVDGFFMKTFFEYAQSAWEKCQEYYTAIAERVYSWTSSMNTAALSKAGTIVVRMYEANMALIYEKSAFVLSQMTQALTAAQEWIVNLCEYLRSQTYTESIQGMHSWVLSLVDDYYQIIYNDYEKALVVAREQYAVFKDMKTVMVAKMNQLMDKMYLSQFISVGQTVEYLLAQAEFYFEYYEVEEHMVSVLTHSKELAKEYVNKLFNDYIKELFTIVKFTEFDLENGKIAVEARMPVHLMALANTQIPSFNVDLTTYQNQITSSVDSMLNVAWINPLLYLKGTCREGFIPPFNAKAQIAGQRIVTFDGKHYDFQGTCSYVLARDFDDGNFTILVNYESAVPTITVRTDGTDLEIHPDFVVKKNGVKTELPVEYGSTSVVKYGDKVIVKYDKGLKVMCDMEHEHCSFWMSGWYFGKTGGLLGTYNNEKYDDFMATENKVATDVVEFAKSWSVTPSCNTVNRAIMPSAVSNMEAREKCSAVFESNASPFSGAFWRISPVNYYKQCLVAMHSSSKGLCTAAKMYAMNARMAGFDLEMPSGCIACNLPAGKDEQIMTPVPSADVVVIVEERMCNEPAKNKLYNFAKQLDSELTQKGFSNNRISLVGFGGKGIHGKPHPHTLIRDVFGAFPTFNAAVKTLDFSDDGDRYDVFNAVKYATTMEFRAGVAKSVVLFTCSDCSDSRMSYYSINTELKRLGISFHLALEHKFEYATQEGEPQISTLFGMDDRAFYTARDALSFTGDEDLYQTMIRPESTCVDLALSNNGCAFDLSKMTKSGPRDSKSMALIFAKKIASTTTAMECQKCSCTYNLWEGSRTVCTRC